MIGETDELCYSEGKVGIGFRFVYVADHNEKYLWGQCKQKKGHTDGGQHVGHACKMRRFTGQWSYLILQLQAFGATQNDFEYNCSIAESQD